MLAERHFRQQRHDAGFAVFSIAIKFPLSPRGARFRRTRSQRSGRTVLAASTMFNFCSPIHLLSRPVLDDWGVPEASPAPMTLEPFLDAPSLIQIHAFAAIGAFLVGLVQLTAPKGTIPHRMIGWSWVLLMLTVAVSSLFIHTIRLWGPWSPIHLLSILVLVTLPLAVIHARRHDIAQHRMAMLMLFTGALVIAGGFTFLPGRIMHAVVFSPS